MRQYDYIAELVDCLEELGAKNATFCAIYI